MSITELKSLAEKATPGPWGHEEIDPTDPEWGACEVFTAASDDYVATHVCKVKDAAYIAAANPAAILELIAQIEDAQKCGNGAGCCFKESKIESLEFQLENAQGEIRALRATEAGLRERVKGLEKHLSARRPVVWPWGLTPKLKDGHD